MKKITGFLLGAVLLLSLCGCADKDAVALGGQLVDSMKGGSMSFSLSIRRENSEDYAEAVVGTGTASGMLSETMRIQATYYVESVTTITNSYRMFGGETWTTKRHDTRGQNYRLAHYNRGTLYFADRKIPDPDRPAFLPVEYGEVTLAVPDALRTVLKDGAMPAGVISDISMAPEGSGKALKCSIAADSDLGRFIARLITNLDAMTPANGEVSAVRAYVIVNELGRLREMDLTVERTTFAGTSERTLTIKAEGYGAVDPIVFPEYVK